MDGVLRKRVTAMNNIYYEDIEQPLAMATNKNVAPRSSNDIGAQIVSALEVLDQSTKRDVGFDIQGDRIEVKNDRYIRVEKNGVKIEAYDRSSKSSSSFKIVLSICITITIIFFMIITAFLRYPYYSESVNGTVTIIGSTAREDITAAQENEQDIEAEESTGISSWIASISAGFAQITPFGTVSPLDNSLGSFHALLWVDFGCLCIYLCSSVILGIAKVKRSLARFITVFIATMVIFWLFVFGASWIFTGFVMNHSVIGPLLIVAINCVTGCVLIYVLWWIADVCCKDKKLNRA